MAESLVHLVDEPGALSAGIALPAVSAIVVFLRFYTRRWQGSRYGPDDWLILAALVLLAGMGACLITNMERGLLQYPHPPGEHLHPYSPHKNSTLITSSTNTTYTPAEQEQHEEAYRIANQSLWSFQLLMYPMSAFTKLSILYYYRRVFWPAAYPNFGFATLATSCLIVIWSLIFFFVNVFDCGGDVTLNWSPLTEYRQHCFRNIQLEQPYAVSDLILNIILLLLPLPTIHQLQLSLRRRVAVGGVILLGSSAIAASAVRVVLLVQLSDGYLAQSSLNTLTDASAKGSSAMILHISATMMYWSLIEGGLALQTACLPTLCVLLPGKILGSSAGGRAGSLVTQVGGAGGAAAAATSGEGGGNANDTHSGYGRLSGWFARTRAGSPGDDGPAAAATTTRGGLGGAPNVASIDAERLAFRRIENDGASLISELDLTAAEPERGRTRTRQPSRTDDIV